MRRELLAALKGQRLPEEESAPAVEIYRVEQAGALPLAEAYRPDWTEETLQPAKRPQAEGAAMEVTPAGTALRQPEERLLLPFGRRGREWTVPR